VEMWNQRAAKVDNPSQYTLRDQLMWNEIPQITKLHIQSNFDLFLFKQVWQKLMVDAWYSLPRQIIKKRKATKNKLIRKKDESQVIRWLSTPNEIVVRIRLVYSTAMANG
jgi:hypothetical protein